VGPTALRSVPDQAAGRVLPGYGAGRTSESKVAAPVDRQLAADAVRPALESPSVHDSGPGLDLRVSSFLCL
jgi:hypothetical protein